jgi:hypothetical protein
MIIPFQGKRNQRKRLGKGISFTLLFLSTFARLRLMSGFSLSLSFSLTFRENDDIFYVRKEKKGAFAAEENEGFVFSFRTHDKSHRGRKSLNENAFPQQSKLCSEGKRRGKKTEESWGGKRTISGFNTSHV